MSAGHVIATVLLVFGVALEVFAVLGVVAMRDVFDRLHYVGLAGFGALLVGVSILVRESFSLIGDKALATGVLLALFGPVLVHATARSFRTRERGDWRDGDRAGPGGRAVTGVQLAALILVALAGTAVVLTPEPLRQALVLGIYGLALTLLFFSFQAPDVALSEIVVSAVGLPVIILAALRKIREQERSRETRSEDGEPTRALGLFAVAGPGLAAVLLIGLHGLPSFGHYHGIYGLLVDRIELPELRHATDIVTALNFDIRAFDTLGEEFILFASVAGVALLLRHLRDEERSERSRGIEDHRFAGASDALRLTSLLLIPLLVALGGYVVLHGALTPGGGFQGGIVLAAGPLAILLAGATSR